MSYITDKLKTKILDRTAVITVIGLGYVGLPTAVQFAEKGFTVYGADKNKKIVDLLNKGGCHLNDLNIGQRVKDLVLTGKIIPVTETSRAVNKSDIILIIVPTPVYADKTPDLRPVISAGEDVAETLSQGKLVVLESTVYPGLTEEILIPILEKSVWRLRLEAGADFGVAHVPERYNPGDSKHSITDVVRVVGAIDPDWLEVTSLLYRQILKDVCEVKNIKTAEASKVIENIQRDLNIALMNELALIFERMGIDVVDVIKAASTKWNFATYYPGAGVGGHCLTTDPYYLTHKAEELGFHAKVILAGRAVNDSMPYHVLDLLIDALNEHKLSVNGSKIVILGMAYKENIGDIREAPATPLMRELRLRGAEIVVIDPYLDELTREMNPTWCFNRSTMYSAMVAADAIVLMTAHTEFYGLDLGRMASQVRTPILIDGRRIFDPEEAKKHGFTYRGVGAQNGGGEK
ncbi:MAG: nucleotide sugar dehydrogenase [Candidatus Ratteibacteria bacterium]|nr:nucleotide sugar dehydrogenase [Candidatus Ratteibacteria bacterium]